MCRKWKNRKTHIYLIHYNLKHLKRIKVSYFMEKKNLSRVTAFSSYITWDRGSAFFLSVGRFSYSFPNLGQLLTLYSWCFQYCEISLRVPSVWSFLRGSIPWDIILLMTTIFLIYISEFIFNKFLRLHT